MKDKQGKLANALRGGTVELELGCGNRRYHPKAVGIDQLDYDCVDVVGDLFEVLGSIGDGTVDAIRSSHCFEHIANVQGLLDESARVLKPGGILDIKVPHFSNPYFYSDLTHRNAFGLYSLSYFASDSVLKRRVPQYQRHLALTLSSVDLIFKSTRPFYVRHGIKLVIGKILNLNTFTREFYEENLTYLFPCYEIRYLLEKAGYHSIGQIVGSGNAK